MTKDNGEHRVAGPPRETITLRTADGLNLVGELARPADRAPVATLICLHPLPTAGGPGHHSHVPRKAANRLPALADLAVLQVQHPRARRLTTGPVTASSATARPSGTTSPRRSSYCAAAGLPAAVAARLVVRHRAGAAAGATIPDVEGAILLSPPLRRAGDADLDALGGERHGRCSRWCPSSMTTCGPTRRGAAVRPGAAGRGDRRRPGQAPVGGGDVTSVSC